MYYCIYSYINSLYSIIKSEVEVCQQFHVVTAYTMINIRKQSWAVISKNTLWYVYFFREKHGVVRNDFLDCMMELRKRGIKSVQENMVCEENMKTSSVGTWTHGAINKREWMRREFYVTIRLQLIKNNIRNFMFSWPCISIRPCNEKLTWCTSGFGGLEVAFGTQVRGFKPGRSRPIFQSENNPQHAFLRRGSKAVGSMS